MISPRTIALMVALPVVALIVVTGVIVFNEPATEPRAPDPIAIPDPDYVVADRADAPVGVNAWPMWKKAMSVSVEWWHEDANPEWYGGDFETEPPNDADRAKLRGYIASNREAIALYRQGVAADYLRVPAVDEDGRKPSWSSIRELQRLGAIEARLALLEGHEDHTADLLIAGHRTGRLIANSRDGLLAVLLGMAMQAVETDAMVRTAHHPDVNETTITQMLGSAQRDAIELSDPVLNNFFARTRSDMLGAIDNTQKMIDGFDEGATKIRDQVGDSADFLLDIVDGFVGPYRDMHTARTYLRAEHDIETILVDRSLTVQTFDNSVRAARALLREPGSVWHDRFNREILGPLNKAADRVSDGLDEFASLTEDDGELTDAQAERIAESLTNGVGYETLVVSIEAIDTVVAQHLRNTAGHSANQIRLALRVHESRFDQPAASLAVLVERGILKSVPIDPYDHQPMRYDVTRGLIWTVGPNGRDDGGTEGDNDSLRTIDKDMAWPVTPEPLRPWPSDE